MSAQGPHTSKTKLAIDLPSLLNEQRRRALNLLNDNQIQAIQSNLEIQTKLPIANSYTNDN